jgi:hypothetical protein
MLRVIKAGAPERNELLSPIYWKPWLSTLLLAPLDIDKLCIITLYGFFL